MSQRTARDGEESPRARLTVVRGGAADESLEPPGHGAATEDLAKRLIDAFGDRVLFLFRRRIMGQTGELPVIAVSTTGVHLIEPRSYPGKKVRACPDGSAFVIDGLRHPRLVDQMEQHAEALQAAVSTGPLPDVAVHTSYCFVDGDLPWRPLEVAGVRVLSVRATLRRLRRKGPLDERDVEALHRDLSRRLIRT